MSDEEKMSFIEHLGELRKRLLWSVVSIVICFIPAYAFSERLFIFLMRPIIDNLPEGGTLIFTKPAEGFITYVKVAFFAALFIAFPFILYQAWKFITPALYKHERQIALPFIVFGTVFFFIGASFCYFVSAPPAFNFLLSEYSSEYVKALPAIGEALSFLMVLILAFGLVFEFPLIVFILSRAGIVTPALLRKNRKYAVLLNAVLAAVITPADVISMAFMLAPLILFYELGILVSWAFGKKKDEAPDKEPGIP